MKGAPPPFRPDPQWAYFLDLDGTLVPLAPAPDLVRVDLVLRRTVRGLHSRTGGAVALISGRPLEELDTFFPGIPLPAAGQHGVERRTAGGRVVRSHKRSPTLTEVRRTLEARFQSHHGLIVEDKGHSLGLHYRRRPQLAGLVHRLARESVARLGPGFTLRRGKLVVEIVPVGPDKGAAIRAFLAERPFRGRTPVFIGDDRTDELGFHAVNQLGGWSIKVGSGLTAAAWRLRDTRAVLTWLASGDAADGGNG